MEWVRGGDRVMSLNNRLCTYYRLTTSMSQTFLQAVNDATLRLHIFTLFWCRLFRRDQARSLPEGEKCEGRESQNHKTKKLPSVCIYALFNMVLSNLLWLEIVGNFLG